MSIVDRFELRKLFPGVKEFQEMPRSVRFYVGPFAVEVFSASPTSAMVSAAVELAPDGVARGSVHKWTLMEAQVTSGDPKNVEHLTRQHLENVRSALLNQAKSILAATGVGL